VRHSELSRAGSCTPPTSMKLIVGLGNPGKEYENTPHNAGFIIIEEIKKEVAEKNNWEFNKKFDAEIIKSEIEDEKIILAKPQTFMNNSGETVAKIVAYYKIKPEDIIIVHDDLDIPLGKLRIKEEGSSAGHNGIESVIQVLGTRKFIRVRIGIEKTNKKIPSEKYVLQKIKSLENLLNAKKAAEAVLAIVKNGVGKAMTEYNRVKN